SGTLLALRGNPTSESGRKAPVSPSPPLEGQGQPAAAGPAGDPSPEDSPTFLKEFLRPDMGRLTELLPELYRRYEPARFGKVEDGDRDSLRALLERLYSQTALARIHDPRFQPSGPQPEGDRTSAYDALFRSLRKEKT